MTRSLAVASVVCAGSVTLFGAGAPALAAPVPAVAALWAPAKAAPVDAAPGALVDTAPVTPAAAAPASEPAKDDRGARRGAAGAQPAGLWSLAAFDLEVDPLAYLAKGGSLHLGLRLGRARFDVGAFSADVPRWLHGQADFRDRFFGWGAKLDVALRADGLGPFAGVDGGVLVDDVVDLRTDLAARAVSWGVSGRAGWRVGLGGGFYVVPWVAVGYRGGDADLQVGERRFERSRLTVFPTVHLGYRFAR